MAIATALTLAAKFAPTIIGLFNPSGKGKVSEISNVVANVARQITGQQDLNQAEAALSKDPNLAYQFQVKVLENETVNERLDEESRKRASEQYKINPKATDDIATNIMSRNLPIIFVLVVVNIVTVYFLRNEAAGLIGVVSNLIGIVIGQLLSERGQVVSFFFGSSLGSKLKSVSMADSSS